MCKYKNHSRTLSILALIVVYLVTYKPIIPQVNALTFLSSEGNVNPSVRPSDVLELSSDNYDQATHKYMVVVLNFYADWCPFSARWKPVFKDTAKQIYNSTQHLDPYTIVFGQVNSVSETTLSQKFRVTKFPTTKLTVYGIQARKEYRGARNTQAFGSFINALLKDPITYVSSYIDLKGHINENHQALILFSNNPNEQVNFPKESQELALFRRISRQLRDDCNFYFVVSNQDIYPVSIPSGSYKVAFKPAHKNIGLEIFYDGIISDDSKFLNWAKSSCIPAVREITFDNAEELTEENKPFVILFYDPNDKVSIELYKKVVEQELLDETNAVAFVYADGHVFSHPLSHLGKTKKDLPLIAIDSFKHLFLYKNTVESISQPGNLKRFIHDLHSGKLDREYHFGPDPISSDDSTGPPDSAFQKLAPSPYRYSFIKDEL